jgi:acetyl esterase/lipase
MRRNGIGLAAALLLLGWALEAPAQDRRPPQKLPEGVKVERDLAYVPGSHERQKLDLYLPEKKPDAPLPLIVWVHGGGWQGGNKDNPPGLWLVKKGYALASINYRLSQHAKFPAQIHDCKTAIGWLRANAKKYDLDPQHVGAWGASAGGHLVALLGTTGNGKDLEAAGPGAKYPSRVQAVVDLFGPTDLLVLAGKRGGAESPIGKLLGGPASEHAEEAKQANPITYVSKNSAPFLILHGDKDTLVPLSQSQLLVDALKKAGVEVRLITLEGAGHGGEAFGKPEVRQAVDDFFDKHLKPKK